MGRRTYLNLTSGLEARPDYPDALMVRIQSSHFESFALWKAVAGLDYQFLIDAATIGVLLVDGGSRRGEVSRAQWQGVPWFQYAYLRAIGGEPKPGNMHNEFARVYSSSSNGAREAGLSKLRYVRKITQADALDIECRSFRSTMDGDYDQLRGFVR